MHFQADLVLNLILSIRSTCPHQNSIAPIAIVDQSQLQATELAIVEVIEVVRLIRVRSVATIIATELDDLTSLAWSLMV